MALPSFHCPKLTPHIQHLGPQLQGSLEHLVLAFRSDAQEGMLDGGKECWTSRPTYSPALAHRAPGTGLLTIL